MSIIATDHTLGKIVLNSRKRITISDEELDEINSMLPWYAGTLLPDGRLLGKLATKAGKRVDPQKIPDKRIVNLDELVNLSDKSVLEVGCFEGIHTIGLRLYCENVTAVDVRPSNVVKTLTRLACYGTNANVFQLDVENLGPDFGVFDVVFHCGVLYHLLNPIEHLMTVGKVSSKYLFLDTHIARDEKILEDRIFEECKYQGSYHNEGGWHDPFSGKDSRAFWLTYDSLVLILKNSGFREIRLLDERSERNGPRVAILASKNGAKL